MVKATNQNQGLQQFFDNVERWCLAEENGSHRFILDVASKLVSLKDGRSYRVKLAPGHCAMQPEDIYVARGIVARRDKGTVLVSFGGLLMALKGSVCSQLCVEDKVTLSIME